MIDNEMLQAMRQLLEPISNKLEAIDNRITNLDNRISNLDNRMSNLDNRITNMEFDMKKEFRGVHQDLETLVEVLEAKDILPKAQ